MAILSINLNHILFSINQHPLLESDPHINGLAICGLKRLGRNTLVENYKEKMVSLIFLINFVIEIKKIIKVDE